MSNSSGISQNNNFSAELLLNKIMNGQVQSNNGNTITLGTRSAASKLSREGAAYGVSAANLEGHIADVNAIQNTVSGILEQVKNVSKADDSKTALKEIGDSIAQLLLTKVGGGVSLIGDAGIEIATGLGGKVTLGGYNINADGTALMKLQGQLATGDVTNIDLFVTNAVNQLLGVSAQVGSQIGLLSNSRDILQNFASDYGNASNNQVVMQNGSSTGLLGNVLG